MMRAHKYWPILCTAFILLLSTSLTACKEPPTISVYPPSLSFAAEEGEDNPPSQTVNISNSGGGTLEWSLNSSADWLTLNPSTGISTGEIDAANVLVDVQAMKLGNYTATITVTSLEAGNSPQTVVANLTVTASTAKAYASETWYTYYNSKCGYSIQYPSSWRVGKQRWEDAYEEHLLIDPGLPEAHEVGMWVTWRTRGSETLDEYVEWFIEAFVEQEIREGGTLLSKYKTVHQGLEAWVVKYKYQAQSPSPFESEMFIRRETIIYHGASVYEVGYYARESHYDTYASTLNRAIDSFEILR